MDKIVVVGVEEKVWGKKIEVDVVDESGKGVWKVKVEFIFVDKVVGRVSFVVIKRVGVSIGSDWKVEF